MINNYLVHKVLIVLIVDRGHARSGTLFFGDRGYLRHTYSHGISNESGHCAEIMSHSPKQGASMVTEAKAEVASGLVRVPDLSSSSYPNPTCVGSLQ